MVISTTIAERLDHLERALKDARFYAENASWATGEKHRAEVSRIAAEIVAVRNVTDAEFDLSIALEDLRVARSNGAKGTEQLDRIRAAVARLNAVKVFPTNLPKELSDND